MPKGTRFRPDEVTSRSRRPNGTTQLIVLLHAPHERYIRRIALQERRTLSAQVEVILEKYAELTGTQSLFEEEKEDENDADPPTE